MLFSLLFHHEVLELSSNGTGLIADAWIASAEVDGRNLAELNNC
jgi:hypothetical protein